MLPRPHPGGRVRPAVPPDEGADAASGALWLHEIKHDGRHMTKQKPLLFPSVPNAPAYLRRMPTKAEVPADLIAAPRLERLSRMACASGSALHSVRLQMGGAPRRSLRVEQDGVMRVRRAALSLSSIC